MSEAEQRKDKRSHGDELEEPASRVLGVGEARGGEDLTSPPKRYRTCTTTKVRKRTSKRPRATPSSTIPRYTNEGR